MWKVGCWTKTGVQTLQNCGPISVRGSRSTLIMETPSTIEVASTKFAGMGNTLFSTVTNIVVDVIREGELESYVSTKAARFHFKNYSAVKYFLRRQICVIYFFSIARNGKEKVKVSDLLSCTDTKKPPHKSVGAFAAGRLFKPIPVAFIPFSLELL